MKLGKIYTVADIEDAKKLIGKKVVASDFYKTLVGRVEMEARTLTSVRDTTFPFTLNNGIGCQFIREVIEEDPDRMTNRQFMRWVRSNLGEVKDGRGIICNAIVYQEGFEDEPVREDIRIRYWDSDEWLIPTYDIYKKDCLGKVR